MSSQDLIKFLTQEFVQYVHQPKDERQKVKQERKEQRGHWRQHWFGMVPEALSMVFGSRRR